MHRNRASQFRSRPKKMTPTHRPRPTTGYTLVEIIAVLAIIAILATVTVSVARYAMKRARIGKTRGTFHKLELAIGLYHKDFGEHIPDSISTRNGRSLHDVLARLNWPRSFTDARGQSRRKPSPNEYDKPSEILFFFLQEMYDIMNNSDYDRRRNKLLLASLPKKEAYAKFKKNELRDTDNDDLPEIVDGWGNPFLYVAKDLAPGESPDANPEPHKGRNPKSFCLYSLGPDKIGYYGSRGEKPYPVGDLDLDGKSDSSDETEMLKRIREFGSKEGYSRNEAIEMANKDNITNWERAE